MTELELRVEAEGYEPFVDTVRLDADHLTITGATGSPINPQAIK